MLAGDRGGEREERQEEGMLGEEEEEEMLREGCRGLTDRSPKSVGAVGLLLSSKQASGGAPMGKVSLVNIALGVVGVSHFLL